MHTVHATDQRQEQELWKESESRAHWYVGGDGEGTLDLGYLV